MLKLFMFAVFLTLSFTKAENSLVLLWNSNSPIRPTFEKISSEDFGNYISTDIADSMLVAFIETDKYFESKDFSSCKLNSGDRCFSRLAQMKNKVFYTNVEKPIKVLRDSNLKKEYVQINKYGELDTPVEFEKGKIVFITFSEPINDGNKEYNLHKQDSIIYKIYKEISAKGKTVGMLTKEYSLKKLKRVVRQAGGEHQKQSAQAGVAFNVKSKFLIYFEQLLFKSDVLTVTSATMHNETANGFEIELSADSHKIKFRVDISSGYWYVKDLNFDNTKLRIDPPISAAEKFSYYCGDQQMSDNEHKTTLHWSHLQMEPILNQTGNQIVFNDPWHCVGFTSSGIWSGLFVTFMMLAILSIGITWLMDIRTMDRFDDPKGKTITVNTSE